MASTIWKGPITFGLVSFPVRLQKAARRERIALRYVSGAHPEAAAESESPVKDEIVVDDRWGSDTRHKHGGYWTTEYTPGMAETTHAWEESRGMGFSYGYNRAEGVEHYHSAREFPHQAGRGAEISAGHVPPQTAQ